MANFNLVVERDTTKSPNFNSPPNFAATWYALYVVSLIPRPHPYENRLLKCYARSATTNAAMPSYAKTHNRLPSLHNKINVTRPCFSRQRNRICFSPPTCIPPLTSPPSLVEPPPNGIDYYIHRTGRTGRKGQPGLAILVYSGGDNRNGMNADDLFRQVSPLQ